MPELYSQKLFQFRQGLSIHLGLRGVELGVNLSDKNHPIFKLRLKLRKPLIEVYLWILLP
jgi:hypothetical protein